MDKHLRESLDDCRRATPECLQGDAVVSNVMTKAGFHSVFQHISPALVGRSVWTLWVNLTTGENVLTLTNAKGDSCYYELELHLGFVICDNAERAKIKQAVTNP